MRLVQAARRLMPDDHVIAQERIEKYDDPQHTWFYIDPSTGLVLDLLDDGGRRNRWWFNALHRLDGGACAAGVTLAESVQMAQPK